MTGRGESHAAATAEQHRPFYELGLGLAALAALALWLAGGGVREVIDASARWAPHVTISLGAATALAAGSAVLLLATVLFLPSSWR